MNDYNGNKAMNTKQKDDFQTVWERRRNSWQELTEKTMPDDTTILRLAEQAGQQAQQSAVVIPFTRRKRWFPYAAAASLIIGMTVWGLTYKNLNGNRHPAAAKVNVDGQAMHFMCNNGCSAEDIIFAVNDVIKQ